MSETVIEARGLIKNYGRHRAVDGVDLTVGEGEVVGLLGPNGAGKTTTILMLLGLTEADSGTVRILGRDPWREPLKVKREVGYLPDSVGFYDNLSGRENLRYTARLGGLSAAEAETRIEEVLEKVRLADVGDRRVGTYSHGMRQRLGLAELWMRRCRVAILDEPTSGLDPQSTNELLALIGSFSRGGMTVLVSSHLLDIVQSICSRVALFNHGRIGFAGTVEELSARVADKGFAIEIDAEGVDLAKLLADFPGAALRDKSPDGRWQLEAQSDIRPELARRIVAEGGTLKSLDAHRLALGEAYTRYFEEASHEEA
jgi:ABC-2 type transport system ATP-binding protein